MISTTEHDLIIGISGKRYRRSHPIGQGAFGKVHIVTSDSSNKQLVCKSEDFADQLCSLLYEAWVIKKFSDRVNAMKSEIRCIAIRDVEYTSHTFGIIMDLGGQSLSKWVEQNGNIRDEKYTRLNLMFLTIAKRSLMLLRELHRIGFIHRDIKPANMTIIQNEHGFQVYLIDFGLAQLFLQDRLAVTPHRMGFVGTLMFASRAAHQKLPQTPRDDVECLFYTLLYINSHLPWRGYPMGQDRYEQFSSYKEVFFDGLTRGKVQLHPFLEVLGRDLADMTKRQLPFDYQKHIDYLEDQITDISQKIDNPFAHVQR